MKIERQVDPLAATAQTPPKPAKTVIAKKPNRVIYAIAHAILWVFLKLVYRLRVDKTAVKDARAPYLLLCNHICNIDFLIAAVAMYPQKLNFMTAALYFQNPALAWLLGIMGCFPKQQFVSDIQSVRNIVRVCQRGDAVVLFPSGQSSFTGQDTLIDPSIAKLIRLARVPVLALRTEGAHIGFPKWNMKRLRRSRIRCEVRPLFTAEEAQSLDDGELYRRVVQSLAFDDYEWQREHRIAARRPRCAEGLEQLLFLCPACGSEFATTAQGSSLRCTHCCGEATMDEYGLLAPAEGSGWRFDTPTAWHRWQLERYGAQLTEGFRYAERAALSRILPNGKLVAVGEAEVSLDMRELRVLGTAEGKPIDWRIDNMLSGVFPHEKKFCFEIIVEGQLYAIAPENPRATFKFILIKEALYRALRPEAR